jgi:hypothetical protein
VPARAQTQPPYSGTIFLDPDILLPTDPTAFVSLTAAGRGNRVMFDRRVNNWITVNAYLFTAAYNDGLTAEVQVNPEFGSTAAAQAEAQKYAPVLGRLPTALRRDMQTVWIHRGKQPFGGGNNNVLIHTEQAVEYEQQGILEETLVHEAAHTSLDGRYAASSGWTTAQQRDVNFISTYARDFPTREDVAESFLPYLAVAYRPDRISADMAATVTQTIPNRIAYFRSLNLAMHPVVSTLSGVADAAASGVLSLGLIGPHPVRARAVLGFALPRAGAVHLAVYDVRGREVAVLAAGAFGEGPQQVTWEAADVPAGVYVARLASGGYSRVQGVRGHTL